MIAAADRPTRDRPERLKLDTDAVQFADSPRDLISVAGKTVPVPMFCPLHMAVIDDRGNIVLIIFPRRGGKDYTVAGKVVVDRLKGISPRDCWYVTLDRPRAISWMTYVAAILKRFGRVFEAIGYYEVSENSEYYVAEIRMPIPGTDRVVTIGALSSTVDGVRGRDGDIVLSELAFHPNPEALFDAATPCTLNGGQILIPSTVNLDGDFHHELEKMALRRIDGCPEPGDMEISLHKADLDEIAWNGWEEGNGYLHVLNAADPPGVAPRTPEDYIAKAIAITRNQEIRDREFYHVRPKGVSSFFPAALVEACVDRSIPMPIRYEAPDRYQDKGDPKLVRQVGRACADVRDRMLAIMHERAATYRGAMYAGVDFGRHNDLFTFWLSQRVAGKLETVCVVTLRRCGYAEMDDLIRAGLRFRSNGVRIARLVGDASGIGASTMENCARDFGKSRVIEKTWTTDSKATMFSHAKSVLEREEATVPNDAHTKRAFAAIHQSFSATGNPVYSADRTPDGHADECCGFVMVCAAADEEPVNDRVVPVGAGRRGGKVWNGRGYQ